MNFLIKLLILLSVDHSNAFASSTINCVTKKTALKYRTLCKSIIDPMKFKNGEMSVLNCASELGDGYEASICEKVNLNDQLRMKKENQKK
jgi:hypothetical protein